MISIYAHKQKHIKTASDNPLVVDSFYNLTKSPTFYMVLNTENVTKRFLTPRTVSGE